MIMFKKMQSIDGAFRHIKTFTICVIIGCVLISSFAVFKAFSLVENMKGKVYILANGKVLEAYASERKENVEVEARDHVKVFHQNFFTLAPDDKAIEANITKALYLADGSAKRAYDDLREKGYYAALISGNVNQTISIDSITIDLNFSPIRFKCYAIQSIVRPTSQTIRSLVTEGTLRNVSQSDNNPHGFLIERWSILENKDVKTENRHM